MSVAAILERKPSRYTGFQDLSETKTDGVLDRRLPSMNAKSSHYLLVSDTVNQENNLGIK